MSFARAWEDMLDSWNERDHLSTGKMPRSPMDYLTDDQARKATDNPADQDDQSECPPLR